MALVAVGAARVIRFRHQSNFWKTEVLLATEPLQQRLSACCRGKLCAHRLVAYNVHLESREKPRLEQRNRARPLFVVRGAGLPKN